MSKGWYEMYVQNFSMSKCQKTQVVFGYLHILYNII